MGKGNGKKGKKKLQHSRNNPRSTRVVTTIPITNPDFWESYLALRTMINQLQWIPGLVEDHINNLIQTLGILETVAQQSSNKEPLKYIQILILCGTFAYKVYEHNKSFIKSESAFSDKYLLAAITFFERCQNINYGNNLDFQQNLINGIETLRNILLQYGDKNTLKKDIQYLDSVLITIAVGSENWLIKLELFKKHIDKYCTSEQRSQNPKSKEVLKYIQGLIIEGNFARLNHHSSSKDLFQGLMIDCYRLWILLPREAYPSDYTSQYAHHMESINIFKTVFNYMPILAKMELEKLLGLTSDQLAMLNYACTQSILLCSNLDAFIQKNYAVVAAILNKDFMYVETTKNALIAIRKNLENRCETLINSDALQLYSDYKKGIQDIPSLSKSENPEMWFRAISIGSYTLLNLNKLMLTPLKSEVFCRIEMLTLHLHVLTLEILEKYINTHKNVSAKLLPFNPWVVYINLFNKFMELFNNAIDLKRWFGKDEESLMFQKLLGKFLAKYKYFATKVIKDHTFPALNVLNLKEFTTLSVESNPIILPDNSGPTPETPKIVQVSSHSKPVKISFEKKAIDPAEKHLKNEKKISTHTLVKTKDKKSSEKKYDTAELVVFTEEEKKLAMTINEDSKSMIEIINHAALNGNVPLYTAELMKLGRLLSWNTYENLGAAVHIGWKRIQCSKTFNPRQYSLFSKLLGKSAEDPSPIVQQRKLIKDIHKNFQTIFSTNFENFSQFRQTQYCEHLEEIESKEDLLDQTQNDLLLVQQNVQTKISEELREFLMRLGREKFPGEEISDRAALKEGFSIYSKFGKKKDTPSMRTFEKHWVNDSIEKLKRIPTFFNRNERDFPVLKKKYPKSISLPDKIKVHFKILEKCGLQDARLVGSQLLSLLFTRNYLPDRDFDYKGYANKKMLDKAKFIQDKYIKNRFTRDDLDFFAVLEGCEVLKSNTDPLASSPEKYTSMIKNKGLIVLFEDQLYYANAIELSFSRLFYPKTLESKFDEMKVIMTETITDLDSEWFSLLYLTTGYYHQYKPDFNFNMLTINSLGEIEGITEQINQDLKSKKLRCNHDAESTINRDIISAFRAFKYLGLFPFLKLDITLIKAIKNWQNGGIDFGHVKAVLIKELTGSIGQAFFDGLHEHNLLNKLFGIEDRQADVAYTKLCAKLGLQMSYPQIHIEEYNHPTPIGSM